MKTEVAIIGAGPAGLAAAHRLVEQAVDVTLIDEQPGAGGQIYRAIEQADANLVNILGDDYAEGRSLLKVLDSQRLTRITQATVWDINPAGQIFYSQQGRATRVDADFIILATGAMERPMPFPGWQLPGVMAAGAGQILLKSSALLPARPLILAGSGPLLLLLANQYLRAGHKIDALVETTPPKLHLRALRNIGSALSKPEYLHKGLTMQRKIKSHGVAHFRGASELMAVGGDNIESLSFTSKSKRHRLDCQSLLVHIGVVPNVQLSRMLNLQHQWNPLARYWQPIVDRNFLSSVDTIAIAGDSAGIAGAQAAALSGHVGAGAALTKLGKASVAGADVDVEKNTVRAALNRHLRFRPFLDALYPPAAEFLNPPDETIVCRCEEIDARAIREYVSLGCLGPNQTKAFGRCGMGPCQGRFCGLTVSEIIAASRGVDVEAVGYYRIRPPLKPVTLAEIASLDDST